MSSNPTHSTEASILVRGRANIGSETGDRNRSSTQCAEFNEGWGQSHRTLTARRGSSQAEDRVGATFPRRFLVLGRNPTFCPLIKVS